MISRVFLTILLIVVSAFAGELGAQTPASTPTSNRERYQSIVGNWRGDILISDGSVVTVVFRIGLGENDSLAVSLDSPTTGREGLPVERASFDDEHVVLEMIRVGAKYDGILTPQGTIVGQWTQGPITRPLTLERQTQMDDRRPK